MLLKCILIASLLISYLLIAIISSNRLIYSTCQIELGPVMVLVHRGSWISKRINMTAGLEDFS